MTNALYVLLGLTAGVLSGFLGLGGGFILIPVLGYLCGLTQHQAQGTTLAAMVPPITLLAAIRYYQNGNVRLDMAIPIAFGFIAGAYMGAVPVHYVPEMVLRKIFGIGLLVVSLRMIFYA
jgi:uncharacterized membrane protein YfcA